jgi:GT2 family glycosyltransferase
MNTQQPDISVVIACYDQAKELGLTLTSFLQQKFCTDRYELIVIDDHSPNPHARAVVARFRAKYPQASLIYVRQFRTDGGCYGSSAKAKNLGLRLARGKFIFFNNAEIVQAGESLSDIFETMTAATSSLCLRGVVLDQPFAPLINRTQLELELLHNQTDRTYERTASADHAGLAAVPRNLLLSVGGIDERFDYWGKEDLDLAARLKRAGATYVYDENLKSFHISHPANHVKDVDYLRMCALLEENNSRELIEANTGVLWGNLNRPPPHQMEGTVIVEADSDLDDLGKRLEAVIYSNGAELRDVLVICRNSDRAPVESFLASRYRPLELFSIASQADHVVTDRVLSRVRTERFDFLRIGFEFGELKWKLKSNHSSFRIRLIERFVAKPGVNENSAIAVGL